MKKKNATLLNTQIPSGAGRHADVLRRLLALRPCVPGKRQRQSCFSCIVLFHFIGLNIEYLDTAQSPKPQPYRSSKEKNCIQCYSRDFTVPVLRYIRTVVLGGGGGSGGGGGCGGEGEDGIMQVATRMSAATPPFIVIIPVIILILLSAIVVAASLLSDCFALAQTLNPGVTR